MLEIKYKPKPEKGTDEREIDLEKEIASEKGMDEKEIGSEKKIIDEKEIDIEGMDEEAAPYHKTESVNDQMKDLQDEQNGQDKTSTRRIVEDESVIRENRQRSGRSKRRDKKREKERKEKKPWRLWQKIVTGLLVLVLAVVLTFGFSLWREYSRTECTEGTDITVTIEQGSSTREVAETLKEAGVIRYEASFLLKIYFSGYMGQLRYGEFTLNDGMCLDDIIEALVTGGAQQEELSFTIPEGYSIPMIAEKLEEEDVMSADEFLAAVEAAAEDFEYADILPEKDQVFYQLEGYLFPDTYYLSEDMTGEELVAKVLDEFLNKFDEEHVAKAEALDLTVEEVLIRASLVQKETENMDEYPTVAGVINNRLEQDMYLQFDSTVVYAISEGLYGVDRVLYSYLEVDSPYNTYKNKGLPVGPICNPSLEAIDGVLQPEEHDYLYFQTDQSKNDGSNLYFETYEEHSAAAATTETTSAQDENEATTESKTTQESDTSTTEGTTRGNN
ncbi:MAG: endolytic transglycosylase MltG [Clostridiales bacterium]|nr:endolytic transglycosylase MltG [Clostridiales bacterium]